jgi:hypothetical protein
VQKGQLLHAIVPSMEAFGLNANHAGAVNHHHTFAFNPSVIDALKEVRFAVTIVVVGWFATTALRGIWVHNRQHT